MPFRIPRIFWCSIFALLSFFLFSCSAIVKSTIKDDGVQIPPDFGKDDVTLLVVKSGGKHYDKALEKIFARSYKGKYLIIAPDQVDDPAYSDISKYRYVFDRKVLEGNYTYNLRTRSTMGMRYMKFQLYDRLEQKTYRTKTGMSSYGKLMTLYLQVLDKKRSNASKG